MSVIKGAALLGIGFGLGYTRAMSQQEPVREAANAFKQFLQDIALEEEIKRKKAADEAAGAVVDAAAVEIPEPDESEQLRDVVDEKMKEGETP